MLEGLITWVLNNYLGKYVENLNTDQLSIALLQGAVELENLPLRKDALRQVGLPIEVRAGFIGKIKLKIPVSQIRSAPWEISIDKLYLVAGPVRLSDWDEESEEQASHVYKLGLLDAIEARWRAETDTTQEYSYYASSYSSWLNYGTSLVTNIVENLQLTVTDVHLRYEDDVTVPGSKIALGVRIESLTAQSCDSTWTPKFLSSDNGGSSFKLLQLSDLGIYLDRVTDDQLWGDLSISELAVAMGQKTSPSLKHDYILSPVSGKAHVKRNLSEHPLRSRTHPRIVCNLNFEEVQLSLSDVQYGQVVNCIKGLDYIQLSQRYRKHRPSCTVKEDPRAWWKYAFTCVTIPKATWNIVLDKAKENVAYVEIYTRLLSNHTASSPLSPERKQLKEKVEWERSFDELRALREVAMFKVRPPAVNKNDTDAHSQGRSILVSWFPQWWGWYSAPAESTSAPQQQGETVALTAATGASEKVSVTTAALEDEILDALADSVENNTLLKRDTVFGQFNFSLRQGTFNLCQQNPKRKSIMELQFENVQLGVESRPRTGSHCFHMTLGAVSLRDHLTADSCFPVLISPQSSESAPSGRSARNLPPGVARLLSQESSGTKAQPLFQLCYEYKPFNSSTDYRLQIHSESLDVVYNPAAVKWLVEFFTKPHQSSDPSLRAAARHGYNAVKQRTKQELLRNWDNILQGHLNTRKIWDIDLAISAPQIFLVEHFNDKNSVLCVVDFGKLHFTNREQEPVPLKEDETKIKNHDNAAANDDDDDDDEEAFQTPCSTPPGSEASFGSDVGSLLDNTFDRNGSISELALHHKIYDRYTVELCDLQILVGKVRDNWKFAHLKGTSTLHVLDRFNISLQVERRIVYTTDPQFPNLTLTGNLPKLVVHVNEQKIQALRTLWDVISGKGLPSPFRSLDESPNDDLVDMVESEQEGEDVRISEHSDNGCAKLLMLQFCVDHMALEVQSRGRSVAELQVYGVKMSFTKRPYDTSLSLSVHGLLLVDALQTFGPDFELLLASHKHVGMDSVSGSLRDSEPTSPTSPGSPDPICGRALRAAAGTSPSAITHALSALSVGQEPHRARSPINVCQSSPPNLSLGYYGNWPAPASLNPDLPNSEALITVEFVFVSANCPTTIESNESLQIANIQFNNLDIIANQETIVELIGFVKRVFPQQKNVPKTIQQPVSSIIGDGEMEGMGTDDISAASSLPSTNHPPTTTRVQLMFDFHRLNILLLRAVLKDNVMIGRKIATATMSQAKISATVGKELVIEGSLGGLQVLDLTPEGQTHQRILSLGQDPLTETAQSHVDIMACLSADLYNMPGVSYPLRKQAVPPEKEAFNFNLKRNLQTDADIAYISVRFASVWYTHSPRLLCELQSCATEFKQYLANLARSIGSAATEMAIGLVHARAESLAQSLSVSLYGSSSDISSTPRKRRRSWSQSIEQLDSGQTTGRGTNTPFSPVDDMDTRTRIQWDVILDTPVVVLPRSANSEQVLVAHLGRMSLTNTLDLPHAPSWGDEQELAEHYDVEIRDMNVYTLDMQVRTCNTHSGSDCPLLRVDKLYDCKERGKPVLHDTVVQLSIEREIGKLKMRQNEEILLESGPDFTSAERQDTVQINGKVVTPLKVSLSRQQYEQVLETVSSVLADNPPPDSAGNSAVPSGQGNRPLMNIEEDSELHTGVSTLNLDPAMRARMLLRKPHQQVTTQQHTLILKVLFDLPVFTVELKADMGFGEQGLVDLSFRDLQVQYDRSHHLETNIQMSLRSLVMEDLLQPPDSKYRCIMNSSFPPSGTSAVMSSFVSKSCPNLSPFLHHHHMPDIHASLPDRLEAETVFGAVIKKSTNLQVEMSKRVKKTSETVYPTTPPPSPRQENPPDIFKEDNLVHINVVLRTPRHHGMNMSRYVTIDFNSLDVVANVESWVVVLDFFGISSTEPDVQSHETTNEPVTKTQQAAKVEQTPMNSEFEISVRSLTLVLNRKEHEVARANMSQLNAHITTAGGSGVTDTEASVGSLSLIDLTPVHSQLYREKFITAGLNLVMKKYNTVDINRSRDSDADLKMEMTSVLYVHTQRFVAELQAFFRHFSQLQKLLGSIRSARKMSDFDGPSMRIKLQLLAASPVILLPMSSRSSEVLIADLGKLSVNNKFLMSGSEGTISFVHDNSKEVLLEVMKIKLDNMDLFTGERCSDLSDNCINLGSYCVQRRLGSLLREKCQLQLKVERNLMTHISHNVVPDMSVMGTLSTLAATVNPAQYRLIRGLLMYNIGEYLDDVHLQDNSSNQNNLHQDEDDHVNVWISMSTSLELVDVSVCLQPSPDLTLACVNFVKSHLVVESFSDHTQDIDLVSQEILITDTRFLDNPVNKRSNVFTNILQPIVMTSEGTTVQAQVHHRRLLDMSKFTILLNNMRLMAILDWWEAVRDFIMESPENPLPEDEAKGIAKQISTPVQIPFEMKLNITDSEIVFVEDTSQWDTNAVILKSTTVITYRSLFSEKPVSCNLNHCEMFSCILGMEDETALSIIDPVTVNMEIVKVSSPTEDFKVLKIQMVRLSLRLSYHDVRMFSQMLKSLPKQTQWALSHSDGIEDTKPANFRITEQMQKLSALGFHLEDCNEALKQCNGQLDDAALWLTQNATPSNVLVHGSCGESDRAFSCLEVITDCLSVCVIDDCRDADVPLIELTMANLTLKQNIVEGSGTAKCHLSSDYYNRLLSGWEPFLEPWTCQLQWEHSFRASRLQTFITSKDPLNINITSTLVELYKSVKENWTQDYYNPKDKNDAVLSSKSLGSPPGYRRRSPFVPFALKNDTGSRLWFTTITTANNGFIDSSINKSTSPPDTREQWVSVVPGDTVPFSFEERDKMRHRDTHKLQTHKLGVRVEGWHRIDPVSVDRVGIYFRQAAPDYNSGSFDLPQARIVLEVTLEGSARKLVTVRSALQLNNQLVDTVEVKLDNTHIHSGGHPTHLIIGPGATLSVPLSYALAQIWLRPLDRSQMLTHYHAFCNRPIAWQHVTRPGQVAEELRQCHSNRGISYRFTAVIRRENYPYDRPPPLAPPLHNMWLQPAHTITLLSALTIVNLLPLELAYSIKDITKGRIKPGQQAAIHEVSQESSIELSLHLENYPGSGGLTIPSFTNCFTARLRVHDHSNRRLYLQAAISAQPGSGLRVLVSASFWLVNKTALPLVFRQEGVATETAGQFEEHEVARMVAPLLFSFSDQDASPTVVTRVGNRVHPEGMPQWCQHFHLVPGVQVRKLRVSLRENRPDIVYMMGIDIRPGRGRYRATNIVTLSAHYQIHNKSSYRIQFAQRCFASTVSDPGAQATYLQAVPDCSLAFHWPRLDKDLLLCLRLMDVPQCQWSGGFRINNNDSFHLNVRDLSGHMYFLRVEIVLQRATYFIVITDADTMPAPIRIDNFSQVAVQFYQTNVQVISTVRAHSSVPYALDEPNKPQCITLVAPGGVCASYDINKLGEGPGLTYENFIYIAFTATFRREGGSGDANDPLDVQSQQLVLDVPDGSGRVVLSRKQFGARSQLWRMTSEGQLQHEGSSPPKASQDKILVLDISTPAPQPSQYVSLTLRRPDKRRTSTQTWRFTEDGRLCCVHNNMCVQAKDGFFGLRRGSEAVLGPPQPVCYQVTEQGIPFEQAVSRQRLRPGSGFLAVKVLTDGPTRVLQISDVRDSRMVAILEENDWVHIAVNQRPKLLTDDTAIASPKECKEFQLTVELPCIGISLVSCQPPEELLYIKLGEFQLSAMWTPEAEMLDAFVRDIQIDNQLFEAQCPVLLYVTPMSRSTDPEEAARPAIQITAERVPRPKNSNAEIVKHLVVRVKNLSVNIEERLMLKLFAYVGYGVKEEQEDVDESDFETQRILAEATSVHAKRYYFGSLKLIFCQVRLSVMTSNKLGENLLAIKRKLGLTLIKFEDAAVELEPFCKQHVFEYSQFLFSSILKHYKDELKWQAAIILGSVDFLGNPLGFVNDLSEGMSGLIYEGNVGALVKNVTHGISNSAAKVTESLSDGLGRVILDDEHEEIRQRIRRGQSGTSGDHLVAGLKGLGFGLLGGVTSVFKQTYEGASNEGFPGFFSGLGKGLVGTVTKPVVGVLDLASEAASAVRDSSRGSNRQAPSRSRLPRCVTSPSGLLSMYSRKQSQGQEFLYLINSRKYSELFMAYEILRSGTEDLRIVISSEMVRVFTCASNNTCTPVIETHLCDLLSCQPLTVQDMGSTLHYIELTVRVDIASRLVGQDPVKRPRVRCDSRPVANWVSQQVNHARAMYIEHQHTLQTTSDSMED